jgi:hypothetical protein
MPLTSIQDRPQAADRWIRPLRRSLPVVPLAVAAVLAVAVPAMAARLGSADRGSPTAASSRAMLAPSRRTAREASLPDVKQLYRIATGKVRSAYRGRLAKAVLYEADGSTANGRAVSAASGITRWRFVFDNTTKGSPYPSATVNYGSRGFGRVVAHTFPYLEDIEIAHVPKLSLSAALARLRAGGYHQSFTSVVLRDPVAPPFVGARYFFGLSAHSGATKYVAVSATSGKIIKRG